MTARVPARCACASARSATALRTDCGRTFLDAGVELVEGTLEHVVRPPALRDVARDDHERHGDHHELEQAAGHEHPQRLGGACLGSRSLPTEQLDLHALDVADVRGDAVHGERPPPRVDQARRRTRARAPARSSRGARRASPPGAGTARQCGGRARCWRVQAAPRILLRGGVRRGARHGAGPRAVRVRAGRAAALLGRSPAPVHGTVRARERVRAAWGGSPGCPGARWGSDLGGGPRGRCP